MAEIDDYDALIDSIYDAGIAAGSSTRMFEAMRNALGASGAGVSIYDAADTMITHTLVRSGRSVSRRVINRLLPLTDDPAAGLVTGAKLATPRRFTDIVPEAQLRHARWFREQSELTGLGHGIIFDVPIAGIRVRLFAVRNAGAPNFTQGEADMLGRIGRHVQRAFAHNVRCFSPFGAARGLDVILYDEDRLAPMFVREDALDRQLSARFGLTPAELRVVKVMARGVTRDVAGTELGIGDNSIKTHMRRIYAKTGAKRLPELLLLMQRFGQVVSLP